MPVVSCQDVRKAALQCTDTYMHKLKKHATEMDKRDEDAEAAAAAAGTIVQNSGGEAVLTLQALSARGLFNLPSTAIPEGARLIFLPQALHASTLRQQNPMKVATYHGLYPLFQAQAQARYVACWAAPVAQCVGEQFH